MPCWVRPISSPPSSIGTPKDSSRVVSMARDWRARSARMPGSVGGAFGAAVPGPVVAGAVAVVLAVGLVVLVVVGDEVAQGEAVVDGDQVDRGGGPAADGGVQVRRAGEAVGELADPDRVAAPEVAHRVAVLAVPLPPQRREPAQVVAVDLADVPRLGDHLGLRDHRVLGDHVEERRHLVEAALLAGQGGRQVEPEPVDVHLGQPVAQRVHDQLQRDRVAGVERVAAAGRVEVVARVAGRQPVVGRRCRCRGSTAWGRQGRPRRCG